jgi:hypothetical protein
MQLGEIIAAAFLSLSILLHKMRKSCKVADEDQGFLYIIKDLIMNLSTSKETQISKPAIDISDQPWRRKGLISWDL